MIELLLLLVLSAQQLNESTLFKIARVLERFDYIASIIVNANHSIMRTAEKLRVIDGVVWLAIRQATEWQRIGNQIDAAMIFAGANFVCELELELGSVWVCPVFSDSEEGII